MKHMILASLLAAALAAPASLPAQDGPTGERPRREAPAEGVRRGGFPRLLEHRAELGLSAEQVARLEAIAAELRTRNQPLLERLRAARDGRRPRDLTPEQRQALRDSLERHRPLVRELRGNLRDALRQAQEVLTPEQREKARELMRARRAEARRDHPRGRHAPGGEHGRRRALPPRVR